MKLETESHLTFSWSFSVNLLSNLCRWVPWLLRNNEAMMEQMCSGEDTNIIHETHVKNTDIRKQEEWDLCMIRNNNLLQTE